MPMPPVDPMPLPVKEFFRAAPLEAQDASYFAASARIESFSINCIILNIHTVVLLSRKFTGFASLHSIWPICSIMVAANQRVFGFSRRRSEGSIDRWAEIDVDGLRRGN